MMTGCLCPIAFLDRLVFGYVFLFIYVFPMRFAFICCGSVLHLVHVISQLPYRTTGEIEPQLRPYPGADPGEVKRVNFHPPLFLSPLVSFFSYPLNIDWF